MDIFQIFSTIWEYFLKTLFFGNYIDNFIVDIMYKILGFFKIPLSQTQVSQLVILIWAVLVYYALKIVKILLKWGIVILLILLILGFFKPI